MTEETRIVEEGIATEAVAQTVTQTEAVVEAVEAETTTAPAAETVIEAAAEAVSEMAEEAVAVAENVNESVSEAVADVVAEPAESVVDSISDAVSDAVSNTVEAVTEKVEDVVEAVSEAISEVAEAASDAVAEVTGSRDDADGDVSAATEDASSEDSAEDGDRRVVRLSVGQEVKGVIKRITDFGAFVDIGAGRDGLIHISELAVGRVNQVADVVQAGQEMILWIKKLDRARNRISLTLISPDTKTIKDINDGDIVPGTVARIVPYGAFIDIGVGTDALLHVREMSNNYVAKPEDVVKLGETLDVRILAVNRRRRRIDLSLKGLRGEPEPEAAEMAQAAAALGVQGDAEIVDPYENLQVLSPMELAFKRAMEAEGVEVPAAAPSRRRGGRGKKNRTMQDEIIRRTLETMRE